MGQIHQVVREKQLELFPNEEELLSPFLNNFDITGGIRKKYSNSEYSFYFVKPSRIIEDAYGFSKEILLIYSQYPKLEPRTIQAVENFLLERDIRGRLDNLTFFLISESDDVDDWVKTYISQNPESRNIVGFSARELKKVKGDSFYVRRVMNQYLYGRDLFEYRLPLEKDNFFFGRKDIVAGIFEAINKGENKGLFGLRKTGKTSVLHKIERQIKNDNTGFLFIYDCKSPSIRQLRWNQLLNKICNEISTKLNIAIDGNFDEINAADTFARVIQKSKEKGRIILVFDEIEYISPIAINDPHWKRDFINFWQTFWAIQSKNRNVCAIIVGVNPYPLEIDTIEGIQNPLFGIVSYQYLQGLAFEDMKLMIRTLGKPMGLRFDHKAYEYLYERYGGHPLLTRLACSIINMQLVLSKEEKPVDLTYDKLKKYEESLDSNLVFYCRYVVSELKDFYKSEYDLLEFISSGQIIEFLEKSRYPENIKHLVDYGLLTYDQSGMPKISIPVVQKYIGYEYMRREDRKTIYKLVAPADRDVWLYHMKKTIISDIRFFEKLVESKNMPSLFGPNSFPEADLFCQLKIVGDKASYGDFITTCYRCFVESIDNYGNSLPKHEYFFKEISTTYPSLWSALYRIRLYRNAYGHLLLTKKVQEDFLKYINIDLEGQKPSQINDLNFLIQQCVLESLFTGIQIESSKLSS